MVCGRVGWGSVDTWLFVVFSDVLPDVLYVAGMIKGGKSHEMLTTSNFSFVPASSRFGPHWLDIQLATTPRGIQRRSVHRWLPSNDGVLHVSALYMLKLFMVLICSLFFC